jgi:hypothetical protein
METEEWKDIEGYEGFYEISSIGNVRSLDRWVEHRLHGQIFIHGRQLKLATNDKDYVIVVLSRDCHKKTFYVHRLVALHYIPNPDNLPEVNHKKGDKKLNGKDDLEWTTASGNSQHAYDTGLSKIQNKEGENNSRAILKESDIITIRNMAANGATHRAIMDLFNLKRDHVWGIINRRVWKHIK